MGTLTANQERLPGMCAHKLPTSCRLSSILNCCACADERPHSAAYPTYLDGIGYVARGTRWQRYCWFCREFWSNRVHASAMPPERTRVPEVPDQSEFLDRWYEFHQRYRVVRKADGSEERVAVLGEDLRDVDPGRLPRTLDELREGRARSEADERMREEARRRQAQEQQDAAEDGPSLEDELDQLLEDANTEEHQPQAVQSRMRTTLRSASAVTSRSASVRESNVHAQAMQPMASRNSEYQARRVAALRRELQRMRTGIERVITGLRDLGQAVPDQSEATSRLSELHSTLEGLNGSPSQHATSRALQSVRALADTAMQSSSPSTTNSALTILQNRIGAARTDFEEARRTRDQAASDLNTAEEELRASQSRLRQLESEQRTTENYLRLFGTREEMLAQGDNYESPIGGMFARADERFQQAEEVRREERTLRLVLEDQEARGEDLDDDTMTRLLELGTQEVDVWGIPQGRPPMSAASTTRSSTTERSANHENLTGDEAALAEYYALLRRQNWSQQSPAGAEVDRTTTNQTHQLVTPASAPVAASVSPSEPLSSANEPSRIIFGGPPGHQLDPDPATNNDRALDAAFILNVLSHDEALRARASDLLNHTSLVLLYSRLVRNALTRDDCDTIEGYLEDPDILWSTGLPSERNRRRRARGEEVTFVEDALELSSGAGPTAHHVEVMAECFQMSARVRQVSGLNAPDQLQMLYRLQRGWRSSDDRRVLSNMLEDRETLRLAIDTHSRQTGARNRGDDIRARIETMRQQLLESQRMAAARYGNHSRTELNARRQAAESVAIAAGRLAMQTGPRALLERMAASSEATRQAYERMLELQGDNLGRENPYVAQRATMADFHASPTVTDTDTDSEDEMRGLDARDSGRPDEPMADEEMTLKLDCRICYSQLSDVACLPCGHLSMCQWCSEEHSPTMARDKTRPRRAAACPVCRKAIRQKVKIFRA